jgi:hypothetical protein
MVVDGLRGEPQPGTNSCRGQPGGKQVEHLAFPGGEPRERLGRLARTCQLVQHPASDAGPEDRLPGRDGADRADDLVLAGA